VLRKIGLEMWFKHHTAQECDMFSEKGKIIGTQTHELLKAVVEGKAINLETDYCLEVTNAIKSFLEFRKEFAHFELQWAELKMTSELHKVNGTLDCLAKDSNKTIVLDWKTGECKEKNRPPIYLEHIVQVCAYSMIYEELYKEIIEKTCVVVFAKDKVAYNVIHIDRNQILECFNNIFLPALRIYETIKSVESRIKKQNLEEIKENKKEEENV
jgi:CRISPR/Cas system-associated exonuclease Cas4 (RecB family)